MRFKYVVVTNKSQEWAVILPELVNHSQAVNKGETTPISAGFGYLENGSVRVEGQSTSLNLDSRPQDAEICAASLGAMGIIPLTEEMVRKIYLSV